MAALAVRLIQHRTFCGETHVDRRQDPVWPFWRRKARKTVCRSRRRISGQELLELEEDVDSPARGRQLVLCNRKIHGRAYTQSFTGVAGHRLLDRSVVLHPRKPRGTPDAREMYGRRIGHKVFVMVDIEREHRVADATQGIEAAEPFADGIRMDGFFEIVHILYLFLQ